MFTIRAQVSVGKRYRMPPYRILRVRPLNILNCVNSMACGRGGFGILVAQGIVDELIYSEVGNEVLLIKHTA
jgi:hypothetical protein